MKLVHQINIAFGVALIVVLSVTAVLIHYVLLDHFIGAQKQEMQLIGSAISSNLTAAALAQDTTGKTTTAPADSQQELSLEKSASTLNASSVTTVSKAIGTYSNISAFVSDENGNIVRDGIPVGAMAEKAMPVLSLSEVVGVDLPKWQTTAAGAVNIKPLWEQRNGQFLVNISTVPQGKLTLYTPMSKIKEIESVLFGRMLLVFGIGFLLIFTLSHFITRKLIRPLMKLKEELSKIKGRQFEQVKLIKAGGEIGSVASAVYDMAGELNRFNRAQKQFFQNASHELKSPLMSIAGYAEGIRDGVFEGEDVNKGLDIILSESGRLKNLVTEMTLLAKLDSEDNIYERSTVDLSELLTEAVERINPQLVKQSIELHAEWDDARPLYLIGDRDKLLQALLNVMNNAVRHAKGHIYVRASVVKDRIELTVSDDGNGIPEQLLPYLFHRFVKGHDGETGLGLAIAQAIVERCGGMLKAANREDGGALFSFEFPSLNYASGTGAAA
ncbi:sensor histidine kinase [Paenibacillus sp. NPDC058071]|uniref:sensor histidine kinase n=1 Tax=Paenibacillus sp. NPDC058071 TaxID=3346326 RepID=UPI0036D9603A